MACMRVDEANLLVLVLYLVFTLGSALWVARRRRSSTVNGGGDDYFLAGRSLGGVQLGLSLVATTMSSVTFLGYPSTSFRTNWILLNKDFALPVVCVAAHAWAVPFFRRQVKLSAFEVLEHRFNLATRLYCSFVYCVLQLARTCTVLYLASLPIARLTGGTQPVVIVCLGLLISGYTVLGGFAAVVFTDVLQTATLLLGGALVAAYSVSEAGGLAAVIGNATAVGKLSLTEDASSAGRSAPLVFLFGLSLYSLTFTVYQDTVQRYCAASSLHQARRAVLVTAALALPIWTFFLFIGTSLWALSEQPAGAALLAANAEADDIVSSFVLSYLPPGLGGLVLAGVMAAAMSSLDSSLNSVAGVLTTDLVQRLHLRGAPLPERRFLVLGRRASVGMAALSVLGALALQNVEKEGMNDLYNGMMSVTGGASASLMLLAIFTRSERRGGADAEEDRRWHTPSIDGAAAVCGILGSGVLSLLLALCSFGAMGESCELSYYWVLPLSNLAFAGCVLLAVLARRLRLLQRLGLGPRPDELGLKGAEGGGGVHLELQE